MATMIRTVDTIFGNVADNQMGSTPDDATPPNLLVPTIELPVIGVRPPDRKWFIDQFVSELNNGQFQNSGRLADGMKRDARILGALEQRNAGLFGAPLELQPSRCGLKEEDEDNPQAVDIRDEIKANWERMFPRCELEKLNQHGILQGIGIAEKIWDVSTKPWTFTIDVRHPQFYLWLWNTGCYHLITLSRSLIRIPRRSTQFINHAPYGYKNAFLDARIRALVDPWMMGQWTQSDFANWCEVHGKPIRKMIMPQSATPAEEKKFMSEGAKLGTNTTIKVRQDKDGNKFDVELLEAASMGWKGFDAMLSWADKKKSEVLCGQSQSMDGQGGLNSQEKPGDGVRQDIKASDNEKLCETLYSQALREYCEYNYGNPDLAPRPNYLVEPPEDKAALSKKDQSTAQALVYFDQAKAPIDARKFLEERGYPLISEEDEARMKQEAADKEQADAEAQRSHELALTKPDVNKEDKANKLASMAGASSFASTMVDLRRAGLEASHDDVAKLYGIDFNVTKSKEDE